jgi:MFS family permease
VKGRLLNRDFVLLWQGQLVSQLGNQAFALAMLYWLMEATGSASLMGLVMMASLLPGVVLGPFGGAVADRYSRKRIIVLADLLRGCSVLGLGGVLWWRPEETSLVLGLLFAVALFGGVVNAVFQPAIAAAIPDLVPRDRLAAANSLNQLSVQASVLLGQALGGILYRLLGPALLFVLDGVSYLLSALSEMWIRLPPAPSREPLAPRQALAAYGRETLEGLRYVWQRVGMRSFLLMASGINFLAMPVLVLLPFYVQDQLGKGPAWYGFLLAAMGGGALVGYLLMGALPMTPARRPPILIAALLALGGLIIAAGFVQRPALALALLALMGLSTGVINIFLLTLFQVSTPAEMRGRVMGLVMALSSAATPLGMALGGVVGDLTGKNIPLIYLLCGGLMVGVVTVGVSRASLRDFLRWDPAAVSAPSGADR